MDLPKANAPVVSPLLSAASPAMEDAGLGYMVPANALATPAPVKPRSRLGGDAQPARLIRSVPPAYPEHAKANHIAGDVNLDAMIDAAGNVSAVKAKTGPDLL